MAGKLSFSIAINLLTENFKRGTSSVKNGFRAMQMQVLTFAAALGAGGLGLSGFVSQLITVARETSRVTTALKNVSGGMGQFADNQRFVIDMAKKYGLEINALTGNFAKFTAASQASGMLMTDQRKIFESVSRACTAFGMSANDSNGVFLALSQMMSKGKISSEELRLQMGERLPIALQAMAKAAGVSVGELDKLMKQGKLMSKDVLPGFADALNEMIPNVDTDNLETSVNRLKNAFTEFTNGTGIQGAYKGIIDWLTGAVQSAGENIKSIVIGTVAVISGIIAKSVVGWWGAMASSAAGLEAAALRSNTKLIAATATRIAAEIALEEAKIAVNNATGAAALAAKQRVIQAEKALIAASAAEQVAIGNVKDAELRVLDAKRLADVKTTAGALAAITRKRVAAEIELEVAKTGVITANSNQILAAQTRLAAAQTALAKLVTKEVAAQEAAKVATIQAASVKSAGWWSRACVTMRTAGAKLVVSLKSMWSAFAPMVVISAIVAIIGKFKAMYDEAKRIKSIFSDYKKEAESVGNTAEISTLNAQLQIMNGKKRNMDDINNAQAQLQKMLGVEHTSQEELNKLVAKRVKLLENTAKADYYTRKKIEAQEQYNGLNDKHSKLKAKTMNGGFFPRLWHGTEVGDARKEMDELLRIITDSSREIANATVETNKLSTIAPPPGGTPDDKKTALQKAEEKYAQSLRELDAQKEIEKMTDAEYFKAVDELGKKMLIEAKASGDKDILNSGYIKMLEDVIAHPLYNETQAELEKVQKEYKDSMALAKEKMDRGLLSQQGYNDAIVEAAVSAANSAISIDGIGKTADDFINNMLNEAGSRVAPAKMKQRDTTFDYKKSKVDISGEVLANAKDYAKQLQEQAKKAGKDLSDELANAMANIPDLEHALKVAKVMEDVKKLREELSDGIYSGMKDVASSADRLVSSFRDLADAFDPESEASGWERLMAVWSALTNAVDSFMSICKMIESLTELTDKLGKAQQAEVAITTAATGVKVANVGAETSAEITALTTQTTAEVAASKLKSTAASTEMASKSTAAYAAIPFVGVGLAAAQIIAMEALVSAASIPKFATGGIFTGGTASGDKGLARLNKGEMILNLGQQSRLFEAINSGRIGGGQSINIGFDRVRGGDILLALNNTLKRQGKKAL